MGCMMAALKLPAYVVDYTTKTIDAVLSPAAINGQVVEVDVYARNDVSQRLMATGQRVQHDGDKFRVTVQTANGESTDDWSYTIIRESAGRSRKLKR